MISGAAVAKVQRARATGDLMPVSQRFSDGATPRLLVRILASSQPSC